MQKYKELLFPRKQGWMLWDNNRCQIIFLKMLSYVWMRTLKEKTYLRRFCTQIASNLLFKKAKDLQTMHFYCGWCRKEVAYNSHKLIHTQKALAFQ